jgi:hypothetical protein
MTAGRDRRAGSMMLNDMNLPLRRATVWTAAFFVTVASRTANSKHDENMSDRLSIKKA